MRLLVVSSLFSLALLAAGANPAAGREDAPRFEPASAAGTGIDTRLNNPSADSPPHTTQNEVSIEACGDTVLAAWNDTGSTPFDSLSGYARSTNRGATWTDMGHFPGLNADPALASSRGCTFYFAAMAGIGGCPAIGIVRSEDGGATWSAPVNASAGTPCANEQDKPWIGADNSGGPRDGSIYACWDDRETDTAIGTKGGRVLFSRSTDRANSFSAPLTLYAFEAGGATGCRAAVGPDGTVNVVWTAGDTQQLWHRASRDGGATFGGRTLIASSQYIGMPGCGDSPANGQRPVLNGDIRTFNWPALAVHPATGSLHVVWNDNRSGNPDVWYSRSANGSGWSAPRRLNDDTGTTDQFQPALAFTDDGILRAIWYDRRRDPAANYQIDVYSSTSADDGLTWTHNERITDTSFGVPPLNPNFDDAIGNCYMGDYIAIDGTAGVHLMAWGDNRNTVGGRPDPDVYLDRRATGGRRMTVTRFDDPPPDGCLPADCSLREAVVAAAVSHGADTIELGPGEYRLTRPGTDEDAAGKGDLDIAGEMLIRGAGPGASTISAESVDRVMEVLAGGSVEIENVTLTEGYLVARSAGGIDGGGVLNRGSLRLEQVELRGNQAVGTGADGGGIHNLGNLTVVQSTISGNTAGLDGGGLFNEGRLTVLNSTISGNTARGAGGGVANSGRAALHNVTVAVNTCRSGEACLPGAALRNYDSGTLELANTILSSGGQVSNLTALTAANCAGTLTSLGHNLEDGSSCGLSEDGDLSDADPLLAPLSRNNGATAGHLPAGGSPAIDAGDGCERLDQRGFLRPADGDGDGDARCDIGAIEAGSRPLGDADCDYDTDAVDALALLRYVARLADPPCREEAGDTDCNGETDGRDALAILRAVARLTAAQAPGCPPIGRA